MPADISGVLSELPVKNALTLTVGTALAVLAFTQGCDSNGRTATWAYISPVIMQPNCATGSCHSPAAAAAGLDFSTPDSGYTSLTGLWLWVNDPTMVGQPGCGMAAGTIVCEKKYRPLVTPFDPSQSRLISVLRGRNAPRMPPDRPLDEADIELIETWILNGAPEYSVKATRDGGTAPIVDGGAADGRDGAGDGAQGGLDASEESRDAGVDAHVDRGSDG
jgi:hypothetical protein